MDERGHAGTPRIGGVLVHQEYSYLWVIHGGKCDEPGVIQVGCPRFCGARLGADLDGTDFEVVHASRHRDTIQSLLDDVQRTAADPQGGLHCRLGLRFCLCDCVYGALEKVRPPERAVHRDGAVDAQVAYRGLERIPLADSHVHGVPVVPRFLDGCEFPRWCRHKSGRLAREVHARWLVDAKLLRIRVERVDADQARDGEEVAVTGVCVCLIDVLIAVCPGPYPTFEEPAAYGETAGAPDDSLVGYRVRFEARSARDHLEGAGWGELACNGTVEQRSLGRPRLPVLTGYAGDELVGVECWCTGEREQFPVARVHHDRCTLIVAEQVLACLLEACIDSQHETLARRRRLLLQGLDNLTLGIDLNQLLTLGTPQQGFVLQFDAFLANGVLDDISLVL